MADATGSACRCLAQPRHSQNPPQNGSNPHRTEFTAIQAPPSLLRIAKAQAEGLILRVRQASVKKPAAFAATAGQLAWTAGQLVALVTNDPCAGRSLAISDRSSNVCKAWPRKAEDALSQQRQAIVRSIGSILSSRLRTARIPRPTLKILFAMHQAHTSDFKVGRSNLATGLSAQHPPQALTRVELEMWRTGIG